MSKNNAINLDVTNEADGVSMAGGTLKRILRWLGSNITLTGAGSFIYTFPGASTTLLGNDTTQTVTNKDISDASNTYRAASTTVTGAAELATIAETNVGTDAARVVTPDGLAGSLFGKATLQFQTVDPTADITTGDGKFYFTLPDYLAGFNLVAVHANVQTAGTTGTTDIQIHNITDAVDVLSTKITIESTETGSETAAVAAVINASNDEVGAWDRWRIDVDAVSTTKPKGLTVTLIFQLP